MREYLIVTNTVTYALKARDILRRNGFKATVEKIVSDDMSLGCGYGVAVKGNITNATELLKKNGIRILKIIEK